VARSQSEKLKLEVGWSPGKWRKGRGILNALDQGNELGHSIGRKSRVQKKREDGIRNERSKKVVVAGKSAWEKRV